MPRPRGRPPKRHQQSGNVDGGATPVSADIGAKSGETNDNSAAEQRTETASERGTETASGSGPETTDWGSQTGGHSEPVGSTVSGETGTFSASDPIRRKRGRPPGSGNKAPPIDISGVEKLLLGINASLQWLTGIPEFDLSQKEAHDIGAAYADVAKYYPAVALDPAHAAVMNLGSQVSIAIGARIVLYKMRTANERRERARQGASMGQPATMTPPPPNINGAPTEMRPREPAKDVRTGEIPGVGTIEFPPDHPLMGGKRH